MGMFVPEDDDSNGTVPYLTDDQAMALAMMGAPPDLSANGGSPSPASAVPQPIATSAPPTVSPALRNGNTPQVSPEVAGLYKTIPQPVGPPAAAAPKPVSSTPDLTALATPRGPAPVQAPNPFTPPQVDLAQRDKLATAVRAAQQPGVPVKGGWGNYFRSIIAAGLAGYGRDPGAIQRGIERGQEIQNEPQAEADKARAAKLTTAQQELSDFDTKSNIQRQNFEDTLKGENAETSRLSEQNRARAEDRQAAAMNTEIDRSFNGGKPLKIKNDKGEDEWVVRTKSGAYVPTEAPEEKPYKTAYERSQSKDPKEAAQGRKDYQAEENRRDQRVANDTTRANADKERADKTSSKGSAKKDPATRHYNDKLDKERKNLQSTISSVTSIPNWQSKPILKKQVQDAYDNFNDNAKSYYQEYQDEAGDNKNIPEPARLPYPWEKGGSTNPPSKSTSTPQKTSPAPASGSKGKPVDSYTSKSGKVYKKGDTIKDGKYAGKKIAQVYDSGQMDLE